VTWPVPLSGLGASGLLLLSLRPPSCRLGVCGACLVWPAPRRCVLLDLRSSI